MNYLPIKSAVQLFIFCLTLSLMNISSAYSRQCELDNTALQSMPLITVQFHYVNGEKKEIKVKLANTARTRAAGFQRVCAATIARDPILFLFEMESIPNFHMRNVVAPIDIAFIQRNGLINSIQKMEIYILGSKRRPLYSPDAPVIAALEVRPEFYSEHGINKTVRVTWKLEAN